MDDCKRCETRRRRRAERQRGAPLETETATYLEGLRRMDRAYAERVARGDLEDLAAALVRLAEVEAAIAVAIAGLLDQGYSYTDVAKAQRLANSLAPAAAWKAPPALPAPPRYGTTRQAARQFWGPLVALLRGAGKDGTS